MTTERKKALLLIISIFVVGVLIGALGMALLSKRAPHSSGTRPQDGKEVIIKKVLEVVEATPNQVEQLRPMIYATIERIDSLQQQTNDGISIVLDQFEEEAKTVLNDQQMERLRELHKKNKERRAAQRR